MNAAPKWLDSFPIQTARAATEALMEAWQHRASQCRPDFSPKTTEPGLTKRLKIYVEDHVSPKRGLFGMWAAENIIGRLDSTTGELVEERRTDIVFGWNDAAGSYQLVFEFKRLRKGKKYSDQYLGAQGLERFVTGIYGRGQAIAAMVGVLLGLEADIIPPIKAALAKSTQATALRLRKAANGQPFTEPSTLFPKAAFDTEHDRDPPLAPPHGTIRVAHFFVRFG